LSVINHFNINIDKIKKQEEKQNNKSTDTNTNLSSNTNSNKNKSDIDKIETQKNANLTTNQDEENLFTIIKKNLNPYISSKNLKFIFYSLSFLLIFSILLAIMKNFSSKNEKERREKTTHTINDIEDELKGIYEKRLY